MSVAFRGSLAVFRSLTRSFASFAISSTQYLRRCGDAVSGLPILTALIPQLTSPSSKLSTAMFESEPAKTFSLTVAMLRCWPTHCPITWMLTAVLPVPGGPWISVRRWEVAAARAAAWESFSCLPLILTGWDRLLLLLLLLLLLPPPLRTPHPSTPRSPQARTGCCCCGKCSPQT